MLGPRLAEFASQRRLLNRALETRCPRADHFHAGRDVPCYPPSEKWPWGWICMERIERDADTRRARDAYLAAQQRRKDEAQAYQRRKARRDSVAERATIAARIAQAAHESGEDDR